MLQRIELTFIYCIKRFLKGGRSAFKRHPFTKITKIFLPPFTLIMKFYSIDFAE